VTNHPRSLIEEPFRRRSIGSSSDLYLNAADAMEFVEALAGAGFAVVRIEGFVVKTNGLYTSPGMIWDYNLDKPNTSFDVHARHSINFALRAIREMQSEGDLVCSYPTEIPSEHVGSFAFAVVALHGSDER
jgi:hypothetical protein